VTTPVPVQITFRHMDSSPALEAHIQELARHLEKYSAHILRCHVVIEPPAAHHHTAPFTVTLEVRVPGEDIVAGREHGASPAHQDPYAAVADAFKAAARRLDQYEAKRHQDVRSHSLPKQP
jgi:ribosomal subunit interface protein